MSMHVHTVVNVVGMSHMIDSVFEEFKKNVAGEYLVGIKKQHNGFSFWFLSDSGSGYMREAYVAMSRIREEFIKLCRETKGVFAWAEVELENEISFSDKPVIRRTNEDGPVR